MFKLSTPPWTLTHPNALHQSDSSSSIFGGEVTGTVSTHPHSVSALAVNKQQQCLIHTLTWGYAEKYTANKYRKTPPTLKHVGLLLDRAQQGLTGLVQRFSASTQWGVREHCVPKIKTWSTKLNQLVLRIKRLSI